MAASSISRGMPAKYPASIQMENGREKVRNVITSPAYDPTSWTPSQLCIWVNNRNSGTRKSMPGTI